MDEPIKFIKDVDISDILAVWGAVLSTFLAWRGRRRVLTTYSFTSSPDIGNEIILYNPTDIPVMINYFELQFFNKRRFFGWKKESSTSFPDDEEICKITIAPHSYHDMRFTEMDYFSTGRQQIRARMHVVGRMWPVCVTVYTPD